MKYINELRERDHLSQIFFCKNKISATTKGGKNYYSLTLQDKTGIVDGKVWELNGAIEHFESLDFIHVEADVTVFAGALQLNIRRIRKASEGEYLPGDYFPVSDKNIEAMYKELLALGGKVKNEKMRQLVSSFFIDDKEFVKRFKTHSAAKSVHHGFIGGLLEHTLAVTKLCDFYCTMYPELNRDLLIPAAMFHDIGKIEELSDFPENDYTDDGQLLGHIIIGYEKVKSHIEKIPGFPQKTASELLHCILAHHGELEYGSPKKPSLLEAAALSFADNTDAKVQVMREAMKNSTNQEWLGYNRFLENNIRCTTPIQS